MLAYGRPRLETSRTVTWRCVGRLVFEIWAFEVSKQRHLQLTSGAMCGPKTTLQHVAFIFGNLQRFGLQSVFKIAKNLKKKKKKKNEEKANFSLFSLSLSLSLSLSASSSPLTEP